MNFTKLEDDINAMTGNKFNHFRIRELLFDMGYITATLSPNIEHGKIRYEYTEIELTDKGKKLVADYGNHNIKDFLKIVKIGTKEVIAHRKKLASHRASM